MSRPHTTPLPSTPPLPADTIAGYRVVRRLGESSFLCLAAGDRHVVLKSLDEDCVIRGKLHPNIKDRLGRVRELAHGGVANLYGIEKDEVGVAWLVWEYVDGQTLAEFVSTKPTLPALCVVAREMLLAVESLHGRGIVHGAIHERNVIVEGSRLVRLTHVSPLLYTEPADDETAVLEMLERIGQPAHEGLAKAVVAARGTDDVLRNARGKIAAMIDARETQNIGTDVPPTSVVSPPDRSTRHWPLVAAGVVALLGVGLTYGIVKTLSQRNGPSSVTVQPIAR
jgi:serine/threonine protein kinase